jgi:hypothetical protein
MPENVLKSPVSASAFRLKHDGEHSKRANLRAVLTAYLFLFSVDFFYATANCRGHHLGPVGCRQLARLQKRR